MIQSGGTLNGGPVACKALERLIGHRREALHDCNQIGAAALTLLGEVIMGFLDVLNGMQNGPRGNRGSLGGGSMSPITIGLLGLLAYKAVKGFSGMQTGAAPQPNPEHAGGTPQGGGIGDWLRNGLGGLLAGGGAGSVLSGGLGDLLKQFQGAGHGDVANSWVNTGANKAVTPEMLEKVLTPDQIATLTAQTGLPRQELLRGISQHLPDVVDHLTPEGRLPTAEEMARRI